MGTGLLFIGIAGGSIAGVYLLAGAAVSVGPLGTGLADGYGQCVPGKSGTVGWELRHASGITVLITNIRLADSRDLRLIGAEVVPVAAARPSIGGLLGYPPTKEDLRGDGDEWSRRHTPPTRIELGPHRYYDIVLGIERTSVSGEARGANVYYSVDGHPYVLPTEELLKVSSGHC